VSSPTTPPANDCKVLTVDLSTDGYGYETSFTVEEASSGKIRFRGGEYASSFSFEEKSCLTNGKYIFTIYDSHGDGICCNDGTGSYSVSLDGTLLKSGDVFGDEEKIIFDVGPPGPTSAPTSAPSCLSTGASCFLGSQCCNERCRSGACE